MKAFKCDICKQYNDREPYFMFLQVESDDKIETDSSLLYQSRSLAHLDICKDCKKTIIKMIKKKNKELSD